MALSTSSMVQDTQLLNEPEWLDLYKAARNGSREAQFNLGELYFAEDSKHSGDYVESIYWYDKAANLGHVQAMATLGLIYMDEQFGITNPSIALSWLWLAGTKGSADAQYLMGISFAMGIGQDRSLFKAILWMEKAADQGHELGLKSLRDLQEMGPKIETSISLVGESV